MARPSVEAERREQILAATRAVVAEKGFKAMRVADVAKRSGASSGTVHYYFETKHELMRAAFEWNFAKSQERRVTRLGHSADPVEQLRELLGTYLPDDEVLVESWHLWISLWIEAIHDPELRELNERVYGEWRSGMAAIIRDGQASGHFIEGDSVMLANALIGMIDGLAIQVLIGSQAMTLERMRDVCDRAVGLISVN